MHDGLKLYNDSRRERGMSQSEARRHAARNAIPSASQDIYDCVDTAGEHALVASAS